jgi:prephenate dehydrogenase
MDAEAPFSRVGVVGLGLMGGSIAMATRFAWPRTTLVGFDRSDEAANAARRHAVHETVPAIADLDGSDLIILAVPLGALVELMPELARLSDRAVVTDVGSTKREVLAAAASAGVSPFIGGHPMGGSERGGLDHARADLFTGRPWLLVPGSGGPDDARRVERFIAGLGAVPQWTDAETHDRTVAYVSHLPQLLAVALMNATAAAVGDRGLSAAGRAFGEMTRLASSPPELWQGILARNADFVAEALKGFVGSLPTGDELKDGRWIRDAFGRAGATRAHGADRTPSKP